MNRLNQFVTVVATLLLLASAVENAAFAQLATPFSSASGYDDSGNAGYTLSAIASPVVTSIAGTGTSHETGDDGQVDVNIGFDFDFFSQTYSDVQVNGNGIIYMGIGYDPDANFTVGARSPQPELNGGSIRSNYNGPVIAYAWDDWNVTDDLTTGGIFTQTRGAAGSQEFVVEFDNVAHFAGDPRGVDSVQLILHEASNEITMHYMDVDGPFDNGFAIGIQSNDFTHLQYLFLNGIFAPITGPDADVDGLIDGTGKPSDGQSLLWTPTPNNPGTLMEVVIDRTDGRVTLHNNTGVAQDIKAYEISALDGPFDPSSVPFLADGDSSWIQLSRDDSGVLSEGHLSTGTLAAGATLDFGPGAWLPHHEEEAAFKFVDAAGNTVRGQLTYTGGAPFEFLDLNFDGLINVQDWVFFRNAVGSDLSGDKTIAQRYRKADLNGDGIHSLSDYSIFEEAYDAAVGVGAFATIQNVPEPSTTLLISLGSALAICRRRRGQHPGTTRTNATTLTSKVSIGPNSPVGATSRNVTSKRLLAVAGGLACLALWTSAASAQTNDRLYNLGDTEPNAGSGSVVGADGGSFGVTWDDAGQPNMGQFHDFTPFNSPVYMDVSGRPDGGSGLGVSFDGASSQYLRATRFGAPTNTVTSNTQAGGTLDYFDLKTRGMAFWVQPGSAAGPQSIVMDTNQHGVRINEDGFYSMRYDEDDFDTNVPATAGVWRHIEVVHPTAGEGAVMYIDGIGVATASGDYDQEDGAPLVIGANTAGTLSNFQGGEEEFFTGIVDELSMYVLGTNDAGTAYGSYSFVEDNAIAAAELGASPNLTDINRDGSVSGDGTGPAATDDVTAFVAGFYFHNLVHGQLVGDLNTIEKGDVNVDGIVDISDWALINAANPVVGAAILSALGAVPEPSSCLLAIAALSGCCLRGVRRGMRRGCSAVTRQGSAVAVVLACSISIASTANGQIVLVQEDFDDLTLGPFVSENQFFIPTDADWTDELPPGWTRDNTTTPPPTPGDFTTGPREYFGWTFLNKESWINQQQQSRDNFTRGRNTVAVADPDGYDDLPPRVEPTAASNLFNVFLMTPEFSLEGLPVDSVDVSFDSSYRQYSDGRGVVDVSFDSGQSWNNLLEYTPTSAGPEGTLRLANNPITLPLNNPSSGTAMVRWGYLNGGNDWWWAIDNVAVVATGDPLTLEVNKATGAMSLKAGNLPTTIKAYEIASESGSLDTAGWNAGNLASAGGGSGSAADVDGSGLVDGADFLEIQRLGGSLIADWKADYGTAGGGAAGEQWEVLNADDQQLFEAYLFGSTLLDVNSSQAIGNGYNTSVGAEDLRFAYRTVTGLDLEGLVTYVGGLTAVPEPLGLTLAALAMAVAAAARRRRWSG